MSRNHTAQPGEMVMLAASLAGIVLIQLAMVGLALFLAMLIEAAARILAAPSRANRLLFR